MHLAAEIGGPLGAYGAGGVAASAVRCRGVFEYLTGLER